MKMLVSVQGLTFKEGLRGCTTLKFNLNNDHYTDSHIFVAPQKYSDPKAKYGVSVAKKKQVPPK